MLPCKAINFRVLNKPQTIIQELQLLNESYAEEEINPILHSDLHFLIPNQFQLVEIVPIEFYEYAEPLDNQRSFSWKPAFNFETQFWCCTSNPKSNIIICCLHEDAGFIWNSLNEIKCDLAPIQHSDWLSDNSNNQISDSHSSKSFVFKKQKERKADRDYERQNIYFKTILRDFRKFIAEDFDHFVKLNNELLISLFTKSGLEIPKILRYRQRQIGYFKINQSYREKILVDLVKEYSQNLIKKKLLNL